MKYPHSVRVALSYRLALLVGWILGGLLLSACQSSAPTVDGAPVSTPSTIAEYFEHVRDVYSGERARDVVAFVAPKWRQAGNRGFDASIHYLADLLERAGYVEEAAAGPDAMLTYRIEERPMDHPTWEPKDATLEIVGPEDPVLTWATNRNMLAINSFPTPPEGVEADLVYVGAGHADDFADVDVAGKVVFGEAGLSSLFREAVQQRGALGVLAYRLPAYLKPETNRHSIQFGRIPLDERQSWGILLSYAARERLKRALASGPARVRVYTDAELYEADELTLVADVRGRMQPDERFVFSAHVQEPGANDNASGVGALAEIARTTAELLRDGSIAPERTLTFLWGDEIRSTRRYMEEDSTRAAGVLWGLSLDMVGEDTDKTGGTFLIEKMPDPSAIWTRGDDEHTEWGGRPLSEEDMTPHYFNDVALRRCQEQAEATGWVVKTNPFEGGSDHVPFLRAGTPGLLFWHFTDQFYHTDKDRIDKVSAETLENVGVCALVTALTLASADGPTARHIIAEVEQAALDRLATEFALSRQAVADGADVQAQQRILDVWTRWYVEAIRAAEEIEVGGSSRATRQRIREAVRQVEAAGADYVRRLGSLP